MDGIVDGVGMSGINGIVDGVGRSGMDGIVDGVGRSLDEVSDTLLTEFLHGMIEILFSDEV